MKPIFIIVVILSLIVGCFFGFRSCQKPPARPDVDSVAYWKAYAYSAKAAGQRYAEQLDSARYGYEMERVSWTRDSSRMAEDLAAKDAAVNHEKAVFGDLSLKYQAAKAKADTAGQLANCDSAFSELTRAKVAVNDMQTAAETSIARCSQELVRRDSLNYAIIGISQGLRRSNDSLARAGDGKDRIIDKLQKKAGKKWSIGIGGGPIVTPAGLTYGVGLTVHRDVIRF